MCSLDLPATVATVLAVLSIGLHGAMAFGAEKIYKRQQKSDN